VGSRGTSTARSRHRHPRPALRGAHRDVSG